MKRFLTLFLAAALCLALAACHRYLPEGGEPASPQEEPVDVPDPGVPADEPLELDALNVEFVAGVRDVDELLVLKSEFPEALRKALSQNLVEAGAVNVTFGTSDEATAEALRSGAVDIGFLAIGTAMDEGLEAVAVEQCAMPNLALTVIAHAGELPAPLTQALLVSLSDLRSALSHYTGAEADGGFVPCTQEILDNFLRLWETGEAVLHSETVLIGGRELTLCGVGRQMTDYSCGIRAIEVWDNDALLQTIEISEAADDPEGGLDEYTSCPEPGLLFRTVDANFDGYDDIEVFGWMPNNTIPYFYWLWDPDAQQFEYRFRLQGAAIDPAARTLTAEYRESAAVYWKDVYRWEGSELVLVSHEQITE